MPKFNVTLTGYANTGHTVTANSPAEAAEKALEDIPTLCHQCTGGHFGKPELELGDEFEVTSITDDDTGAECPTGPTELDRLRGEVARLTAQVKELKASGGSVTNSMGDVAGGASFIQAGHVTGSIHL